MNIQATATTQGFDLLLHHVEEQVWRYALLGHADLENAALDALVDDDTTYESIGEYSLMEADIEAAYYDMEGVLTFTLPLPYEANFDKYIYGIALIGEHEGQKIVVSISKTPKIYKVTSIGGLFTYKVDIRGEAGNIIYTSTLPYASAKEAEEGISMDKIISPATMAHVLRERMAESIDDTRVLAVPSATIVREAINLLDTRISSIKTDARYLPPGNNKLPAGGTWVWLSARAGGSSVINRGGRNAGGTVIADGRTDMHTICIRVA